FCVEKTMDRVRQFTADGSRKGGVVWHTQGSGKSLTMVMLAKALSLEPSIRSPRIVLVTDRVDLDDQIYNTFRHTGKDPVQAKTGRHLLELLSSNKEQIITTVIDKFEAAVGSPDADAKNSDPNIFVLVDEGHRTQYGPRHAKMRNVLPLACYLGFTGTPVAKKDRNTVEKFGGLIDSYTITQATEDKAVVRLLYEGRHVPQKVDAESLDNWFEKITHNLTKEQVADLKRKFATADQLNKAEQKIKAIAWDISMHWSQNWSGTGFKAQLVAPDKATALFYKKYLDEFGLVSSEVLISGPSEPEGDEDIYTENTKEVMTFWKGMMQRFGTDKEYNRQLISAFKSSDSPEIIVVVDKLLTGFDAPRNTVLYLTRSLKDHTLLQAIARVNRLHDGKECGYIIDYRGVLENLDQALSLYSSLAEFDAVDLADVWRDVSEEIGKLPQKHSDVWDVFKGVKNRKDVEEYELLLADDALRARFYERFRDFGSTLGIAMASERFLSETPAAEHERYRQDLKFFGNLRVAVQRRYAERISYAEYEPKIRKLIDTHVGTGEVENITPLVDIFDQEAFAKEVDKVVEPSGKADTIAHRLQKTITDKWQEDPAFYEKFSKMLEEAIRAFREQRIAATQYLKTVTEIMTSVVNRADEDVPQTLNGHNEAKAFYGIVNAILERPVNNDNNSKQLSAEIALRIDEILESRRIVNWVHNPDQQNLMRTEIEDYLFDSKDKYGVSLTFDDIDRILEECIEIFKVRRP
ncbi:MAG: HsdR family type I site-specific deoxyribonuclease, partial [candidate division Zixibacteria bacterium]|nr:HsdR family type I site-specific deoxyribonuclease [candidate division Zixibacteria bacterium]